MSSPDLFSRFAPALSMLPTQFAQDQPLPASLRLSGDSRFEVFYAPFDYVNPTARVVLVGITPGRAQALKAIATARDCLLAGVNEAKAAEQAKSAASFAGPMRNNLVQLLDHVGLASRLQLESTAQLWTSHTHLVHFTSALRYPVFEAGNNYTGTGITRHAVLLEQLDTYFSNECTALPKALFVPLGSAAESACDRMVASGKLASNQLLRGLPHPSGANAERIAYFLGRKDRALLSVKTRPEPLDDGRIAARRVVEGWAV